MLSGGDHGAPSLPLPTEGEWRSPCSPKAPWDYWEEMLVNLMKRNIQVEDRQKPIPSLLLVLENPARRHSPITNLISSPQEGVGSNYTGADAPGLCRWPATGSCDCTTLLTAVSGSSWENAMPRPLHQMYNKTQKAGRYRRAETNIPTFTCPSGFHEFIAGPAIRSQKSALMISGFWELFVWFWESFFLLYCVTWVWETQEHLWVYVYNVTSKGQQRKNQ